MNNLRDEMEIDNAFTKQRILSQNNTFKTAFTATLGFYAGQTVATFLGIGTFAIVGYLAYKIFN